MRTIAVLAAAALVSGVSALPARAQSLRAGWYVIAGSYPYRRAASELNTALVVNAADRCGFRVDRGVSENFLGLRPGLVVQTIGAYRTRRDAEKVRDVLRRCIPDAFVKQTAFINDED